MFPIKPGYEQLLHLSKKKEEIFIFNDNKPSLYNVNNMWVFFMSYKWS